MTKDRFSFLSENNTSNFKNVIVLCMIAVALAQFSCDADAHSIDLSGQWSLELDPAASSSELSPDKHLEVSLPGTLNEACVGEPLNMKPEMIREVMLHLQQKHSFVGKASYRKTIEVPFIPEGTRAILKMERIMWKSSVYVDGNLSGSADSLTTPHRYDLTEFLHAGKHELVIEVDNTRQFDLNKADMAHAYTNETQVMWNGILGDFSIEFEVFPELENLKITPICGQIELELESTESLPQGSSLKFTLLDPDSKEVSNHTFPVEAGETFVIPAPDSIRYWDEFSPALYTIKSEVIRGGEVLQSQLNTFGFRNLEIDGKVLKLNGKPIFLRGTLECSIFPLTGHPPLTIEGWEKVYGSAKAYGLNHLRFHSWCPPEAAFEAADKMGIYLQVELPNWNTAFGDDEPSAQFVEAEAERILKAYGNHPSFCLMSMGNELEGDFDRLHQLVAKMKREDKRHLYTTTTFTFQEGHGKHPEAVDDFFITQYTDKGWVRGQGVFDSQYPDFETDYSASVDHLPVPLVTHEIGQYSVYPNLKEIEKYTGVLEPVNFKAIHQDLEQKGLLHLADDYLMASGMLAKILYKEEIERALKTEGISGFQLLDLHDFPGQGTALVGLLDAFWDSKGIVGSDEFRTFCSEVVPLIWMEKAVYRKSEQLSLQCGVANYGQALEQQALLVELLDGDTLLDSKMVERADIPSGATTRLGSVTLNLSDVDTPNCLTIRLSLPGTTIQNSWQIWVYPEISHVGVKSNTLVTRSFRAAVEALGEGRSVIFSPELDNMKGLEGKFVQVFWSPVHFPDQPGTMGLLIDPEHPAFREFPTEFHSNWQWWDLCKKSKTLEFGDLAVSPLIRVVDNFFKNRNLTNLFEAKVGKGKLIFSSIDLISDIEERPEAAQLLESLLNYMQSDAFNPNSTLSYQQLKSLLRGE